MKKQLYIVDGYNMIGAWPELVALKKQDDLESARDLLIQRCSNFQKFENIEVWIVFDAQFVPGITQSFDQAQVKVIFTSEGETADSYIERSAAEMNTVQNLVEVATSDLNEQWAIFSQGALRVSARELEERVNTVKSDLDKMSAHIDLTTPKLRPWDDAQLGKLQNLLNEIE